ncbi:MAG: hypothetical protein HZC36_02195 [Armatimonadetes bacterium]|nr:hypothetical protein [Armatimonadota bacterium]
MILHSLLSRPKTWKLLGGSLAGIWVLVGCIVGWWTFAALSSRSAASDAILAAKNLQAQIDTARESISKAENSATPSIPRGFDIIRAFQNAITSSSDRWGCTLSEFQAAAQLNAYLSRFAKDTPANDWKQIDVTLTVRGPAPNVVALLKEVSSGEVPFEFNTIEFRPMSSDRGTRKVSCAVSLRLITKEPGGKA